MKACAFENQVQQWHDGEFGGEHTVALFHHLAECEQCRSLLSDLKKIRHWARQAQLDFPDDLDRPFFQTGSSRSAVSDAAKSTEPFWKRRVGIPVPVYAAMLFLLLAFIFAFGRYWEQQAQRRATDNSQDMIASLTFALPAVEIWSDGPAPHLKSKLEEAWDDHAAAMIQPPRPLRSIVPTYPDMAREYGLEGQVALLALVDAEGKVSNIKIVQNHSAAHEFAEKASAALQHARFQPGRQYGRAAASWILIPYVFHNQKPSTTQEFIEHFI